jgi:Spy/CpxP family protein refolding chaperone
MRQLDLNTEQREKIADLRDRQQRRAIQKRADLRIAGLDLRKLMRAEHADRVAINRQIDTISRIKTELRKSQVETLLDMREVLTPEQQKKLRDLRGAERGFDG